MTDPAPGSSWAPPPWVLPFLYVLGGGGTLGFHSADPDPKPLETCEPCEADPLQALIDELSACQRAHYRPAEDAPASIAR